MSEQIPNIEAAPAVPEFAAKKNTAATVALTLGILAMVLLLLAPVAMLLAAGAIVFGILGIRRVNSLNAGRVRSVWGLVLGAVALPLALIVLVASAASFQAGFDSTSVGQPEPDTSLPSEAPVPIEKEVVPSKEPVQIGDYAELGEREFALLVKNPDAADNQKIIVYGVISQLDGATGPCSFLASIASIAQESSWDYLQNSWFDSGDGKNNCPMLDDTIQGDHLKLWATVTGSLSYDTQAGGNTTVPRFSVDKIELLPALEF